MITADQLASSAEVQLHPGNDPGEKAQPHALGHAVRDLFFNSLQPHVTMNTPTAE